MKLSPAEKNIYTILAERAGMTLDDWLQSLPSAELARLEADDPDTFQDLMLSFAKRMLDPTWTSPLTSTAKPENYRTCPSCNENKYAGAYPSGATICLRCTRKTAEAETEPEPEPPPQEKQQVEAKKKDGRGKKTCTTCNKNLSNFQFNRGSAACKACEIAAAQAPSQEGEECRRCNEVKPLDQFSLIQGVCTACMTVAKAEAKAAIEKRNQGAGPEKVIPGG